MQSSTMNLDVRRRTSIARPHLIWLLPVLAVALSACGSNNATPTSVPYYGGGARVLVEIGGGTNCTIKPTKLRIARGTDVVFRNSTSASQTLNMTVGAAGVTQHAIPAGGQWSHVFKASGRYPLGCQGQSKQLALITVKK
jgi:plastocyanin